MSIHHAPLRYPGGKQRLSPFIQEVLDANDLIGGHYSEPYAGGAGVAINLLVNNLVEHVHLNDSSFPIYAFWRSIIDFPEAFCQRIKNASLTIEEWKYQREILRNYSDHDVFSVGFSTFYLNRCNRSGVLSGGVIGGLKQEGKWKMDARFTKNELIRRIEVISQLATRISATNLDAEDYIDQVIPTLPQKTLVYCDPPYFRKSQRLYLDSYTPSDHKRISEVIQNRLTRPWLVSYDGADEIIEYYSKRRSFLYQLQYNAAKAYKGEEVFVFSDGITIPQSSNLPYVNQGIQAHHERLFPV